MVESATMNALNKFTTLPRFFAMLVHSNDPNVLKHSAPAKDKSGDDACVFHEHFKVEPILKKLK